MPKPFAKKVGMCEVNIHIFAKNSKNAREKTLFRDFLTSSQGADLRKEYCNVKLKLKCELSDGLPAYKYALRKNAIVAKILNAAYIWGFRTDEGKKAMHWDQNSNFQHFGKDQRSL